MASTRLWTCVVAVAMVLVACGDDGATPSGTLPPIVTVATTSTSSTVAGVVQQQFYVIQSGDTLGGIARNFGVTEQALMELNAIADPNHIEEGQTIEIPPASTGAASTTTTAPTPGT